MKSCCLEALPAAQVKAQESRAVTIPADLSGGTRNSPWSNDQRCFEGRIGGSGLTDMRAPNPVG